MFNLRWCGIAGGGAFLLSFLVALISGAGFPALLMRPLLFGVAFFVLAGGIWLLVNRFVPDLLSSGEEEAGDVPGSRVDISVGDDIRPAGGGALPSAGAEEDVGNIAELLSGGSGAGSVPPGASREKSPGLDQNGEGGYTERERDAAQGDVPVFSAAPKSAKSAAAVPSSASADALPDLDSMAEAFLSRPEPAAESLKDAAESRNTAGADSWSGVGPLSGESEAVPPVERRRTSGKGQSMGGDFNPKDLASAMRTLLSKD
ncbi:MAG: hypothetical protein LBG42_02525 [Treponema sp.]|nr:hypothetical protein [Treponema sp.]